ncbi:hypothetical protein ACJ2A9_13445, partial [Anaerobacillus sp. MEB173]|uniref:hypothetical protein n=1 Tax=Anaerobacillus sp. MEB173 TaxID=3383345 RepID=UPI003F92B793
LDVAKDETLEAVETETGEAAEELEVVTDETLEAVETETDEATEEIEVVTDETLEVVEEQDHSTISTLDKVMGYYEQLRSAYKNFISFLK